MSDRTLEQLWDDAPPRGEHFDPSSVSALPAPAQRYLKSAIAPGTPAAYVVRLEMHGEIKLGDAWSPFEAEQVMHAARGFVWKARVRMKGLPVRGSDRWVDGVGALDWRLLGIVPVVRDSSADISRSAAGRSQAEAIWLPSILASPETTWRAPDGEHADARVTIHGESTELELGIGPGGELQTLAMLRWGDPDQTGTHALRPFGGVIEEEGTFEGFTIPTKVRIGWHFGTPRWAEGEFFRGTVTRASYR